MTDADDAPTRRRLLAALAGTAATASLAGCPGEESPGPGPPTETERAPTEAAPTDAPLEDLETVNVVEAGASPDGDEPIEDVIEPLIEDGTALHFPPGEYLLGEMVRRQEFEDVALVGEDATVRAVEGFDETLFAFGGASGASGLTIRGLEFDVSAPDTGARPIDARVTDGLDVRDVTVTGRNDVDQDAMRFDVVDEEGRGVVERLSLPDGADHDYPVTGCYVGESHLGTLRFVDCEIAGFPDNGLYASPATGRVDVLGGRYENSDVSNVRVSGPATVRGVAVRCDASPESFQNMRGIRLREGEDVLVENCAVELADVSHSDGAITCANWLESATIRNTRVDVDTDGVPGILAKSAAEPASGDEYRVRIEDVTVAGGAGSAAAISLLERDACLVDGACVYQPGSERDGVRCTRVSDSAIRNSEISVTGEPVVLQNASVNRRGLTTERLSASSDADGGCGGGG